MAVAIPDKFHDLLTAKPAVAVLATIMPDNSPQATPVWFDYQDGRLRINTAAGRRKQRNLDDNPRVAVVIPDPENPYRYIQLRGRVAGKITGPAADQHIDRLARKYLNLDQYPYRRQGETRIIYEIEIGSCQTMG